MTRRPTDLAVLAMIAGFSCGISALACFIDLARFVLTSIPAPLDLLLTLEQHHQNSTRQHRSSIVGPGSLSTHRYRADSGGTRLRSDSDRTEKFVDGDFDTVENHPVEPRSRTALLPPIMVSLLLPWSSLSKLIKPPVQNRWRRSYLLARLPE